MRRDKVDYLDLDGATRRFAVADIKLLRLSLLADSSSFFEGIGSQWVGAQPSENLSPGGAAETLKCLSWSRTSSVKERYRKLLLRYPPEQFSAQHMDWRPAEELLGSALNRLNWYWQSGLIPGDEIGDGLEQPALEWLRARLGRRVPMGSIAAWIQSSRGEA